MPLRKSVVPECVVKYVDLLGTARPERVRRKDGQESWPAAFDWASRLIAVPGETENPSFLAVDKKIFLFFAQTFMLKIKSEI